MIRRLFVLLLSCGLVAVLLWWGQGRLAIAAPASEQLVYLPVISKPVPPPVIVQFEANVTEADPGQTITLTWHTTNTTEVTLFHLLPTGQFGEFWEVTAVSAMTYTISISARNESRFLLMAGNSQGVFVQAGVTIHLTCPHEWFFVPGPDSCAAQAPLWSPAAEQSFEAGTMIWIEAFNLIYVLFADEQQRQWQAYPDEWQEGDPIDDPSLEPPPDRYQPQRGFGLVWREQPEVKERLGWAILPEVGYETAVQTTAYGKYNDLYILAADESHVWRLGPEGSQWEKFNPIGAAHLMATLINQTRAEHQLPPYTINLRLNQAAHRHNLDMAHNQLTSHTGSDGSTPLQRISQAGYPWHFAGEIIGWGFSGNHQVMLAWWLNSDIHRQMILSTTYQDFGLSYVNMSGSEWGYYWTITMGKPLAAYAATDESTHLAQAQQCITDGVSGSSGGGSSWQCTE